METEAPAPDLDYGDAVILGIVEGITEYLPISSTGHLLLTNRILGLDSEVPLQGAEGQTLQLSNGEPVTMKTAADAYAIVIQFGAILAVMLLYHRRIRSMIEGIFGKDPMGSRLLRNLVVSFLPAAFLGLLLDDWIESLLFNPVAIAIALFAGGGLMLFVEARRKRNPPDDELDLPDMTIRQSLTVGFLQCIAMWPGTSRSMMAIVGGYWIGLRPAKAAEYSFLLGLITLTAAAGYKSISSREALLLAIEMGPLLVGLVVAFIFAALSIKWLVGWLSRHGLAIFAWYRFVLAVLVLVFLA